MGKICIKCGYERRESDRAPDYACPSCGVVYAKAEAAQAVLDTARMRASAIAAAQTEAAKAPTSAAPADATKSRADAMIQQFMAAQANERRGPSPHRGMAIAVLIAFAAGFASAAALYSGMQKMGKAAAQKVQCTR